MKKILVIFTTVMGFLFIFNIVDIKDEQSLIGLLFMYVSYLLAIGGDD